MENNIINLPKKPKLKREKKSINDFQIDISHYKVKGPKVVKTIDIEY